MIEKKRFYPKVSLVGRTNVGKSTLFNRLTKTQDSLVFDRDGVTRDFLENIVTWNKKAFNLVDTGGIILGKLDEITKKVEQSIDLLVKDSDLVLFVCDLKNGLTERDRTISKALHKSKKNVVLVLNKSDNKNSAMENEYEFYALGFDKVFMVSAIHGTGINELLDEVLFNVETKDQDKNLSDQNDFGVSILGKPNVGKSSLINLLLKEDRSIVSDIAGTTRQAISQTIPFHKENVELIDTPGVRRKSKVKDPLELEMVKQSFKAVRKSDIVLVMIDSSEGKISDQELKLLFYAYEEKKSVILILNKTDILTDEQKDRLKYDMLRYEFLLKKIPCIWISCKTEKNVGKVFKEVLKARTRRKQDFDETEVNEIVKEAIIRKPMYHKRQVLKVLNIKVLKNSNVPTFALYVNYPTWFGPTQLGFIENVLRKNYDLLGCPVSFIRQKV